jgi:exonuclease SbcC
LKPLKLTITGLHSFTDKQVIDFEDLCDTGLFGIFGPTGSGKSSILDAITLALYGNVERAPRGTTGILNSQKELLEVAFTFAIGIDSDRQTYRVERSFKRNRAERDSVRAGICRLIQINQSLGSVIAEGSDEVSQKVVEIIGLTMIDFTRSVVLPQGEFAKFLKMGDAERVRMLERIFALSEFGVKLIEKVKQQRAKLVQELGLLERAVQEQGEITPEVIAKLAQELEQLELEKKEVFFEFEQTAAACEQTKSIWELQTELKQLETEAAKHAENQPNIAAKKTVLIAAETAEMVRPYLENYNKANSNLDQAQQVLQDSLHAYETVAKNHRLLKEQLQQAEKEFREEQPQLIEQKTRLQALAELEQEQTQKEQVLEGLRSAYKEAIDSFHILEEDLNNGLIEKDQIERELNEIQAQITGLSVPSEYKEQVVRGAVLERDYRNTREEFDRLTLGNEAENREKLSLEKLLQESGADRLSLDDNRQQLKSQIEQLSEDKPGDINYYQTKNDELAELEKQINSISLLSTEVDKDTEELTQYRNDLQTTEADGTRYREKVAATKDACLSLEERINGLRAGIERLQESNSAYRLVHRLVDGEPCPVCGSPDHPDPVKSPATGVIDSQKAELAETEAAVLERKNELDNLNQELSKYRTIIEQKQNQLLKIQGRIDEKNKQIEALKALLSVEIRDYTPDELTRFADDEKQKLTNLQLAMNQWETRNHEMQQRLEELKEQQSEVDAAIKEKEGRLVIVESNIVKLQDKLGAMKLLLGEKEEGYTAIKAEMNIDDFQTECNRVLASDRQTEELRGKYDELTNQLKLTVKMLEEWKLKKETAQLKLGEIEFTGKSLRDEVAEKRIKIREAVGDRQPREMIGAIEQRLGKLTETVESFKMQMESSLEALQSSMTAKSERQKTVGLYQEAAEMARANLDKKLSERGFSDTAGMEGALRDETERELLREEITEYEDLGKKLKQAQETLLKKIGGRNVTTEEWAQIQQLLVEMNQRKDLLVEQVAKTAHNLEDFKLRYQKIEEYQKQQTILADRKALADELIKLLQGDSLVAYIAEEHLHYILKDASARLAMLTNKRYVLRLDPGGGPGKDFIIQDNTNGGISRPVSSLSGGETFLVSLSLALALSSQIQLKGVNPLEFFFLDEGFGTLDPQLLEVVTDSLEKLRHENLTVGIISHVPELRNRISRRLIVTPASFNGTGSRVRIEKA